MIRSLLLLFVGLFIGGLTLSAQPDQWETYYENDQVRISYQLADDVRPEDGVNNKVYLLKYENLTAEEIELNFKRVTWYGNTCHGCESDDDEYKHSIVIAPNSTISKTPGERDKAFYIYHSRASGSGRTLTKFELQQITSQAH